jgi:MFS family permease
MLTKSRLKKMFPFKRFKKEIWVMVTVRFIMSFGFAVYAPYFMLYLNRDRGLYLTLAGFIIAFNNISGAFSQILGGAFTDRFGHRLTMLFFLGIGTLINIGLTMMVAASTTIWLFSFTYIISGFVWGMIQPAINVMITDFSPKDRLTESFGLSQLVLNLGWIVGPLLGGYLYYSFPFTLLISITIFTSMTSFILVLTTVRDSWTGLKNPWNLRSFFSAGRDRALMTYALLNFLVFTVFMQIITTYSVFIVKQLHFTTAQYGLIMMVYAILAVIFQFPATRLVGTYLGDKYALFGGSLCFGIYFLSLSWIASFQWSVAATVIIAAAEVLFVPSSTSTIGRLARPEQRGLYLGVLGTSAGLGVAMAPLLGGALFDASHGTSWLIWGPLSALTFIAAMGYLKWFSSNKKRFEQSSPTDTLPNY